MIGTNLTTTLEQLREFKELDNTYSNFDGVPPKNLADDLRKGGVYCAHPGWDHWGRIWFENGKFHELVMRYHVPVEIVSGETPEEVWRAVNDIYGSD